MGVRPGRLVAEDGESCDARAGPDHACPSATLRHRAPDQRLGRRGLPGREGVGGSQPELYLEGARFGLREREGEARASARRPARRRRFLRGPRRPAGRSRVRGRSPGASGRWRRGRSGRRCGEDRPASMPGPWSRTVTAPSCTVTSTGLSGGLHLTALSIRLEIARPSVEGAASTVDGSSSVWKEICERRAAVSTASSTR